MAQSINRKPEIAGEQRVRSARLTRTTRAVVNPSIQPGGHTPRKAGKAKSDGAVKELGRDACIEDTTTAVKGLANDLTLLVNWARMEGVLVGLVVDLETYPETLLKLFNGANFGTLLRQIATE